MHSPSHSFVQNKGRATYSHDVPHLSDLNRPPPSSSREAAETALPQYVTLTEQNKATVVTASRDIWSHEEQTASKDSSGAEDHLFATTRRAREAGTADNWRDSAARGATAFANGRHGAENRPNGKFNEVPAK